MTKYTVTFWYDPVEYTYVGKPDLQVNLISDGLTELDMDEAFKEVMTMHGVSSVVGAVFTVYNAGFPKGYVSHRQGLTLINNVYSFTGF